MFGKIKRSKKTAVSAVALALVVVMTAVSMIGCKDLAGVDGSEATPVVTLSSTDTVKETDASKETNAPNNTASEMQKEIQIKKERAPLKTMPEGTVNMVKIEEITKDSDAAVAVDGGDKSLKAFKNTEEMLKLLNANNSYLFGGYFMRKQYDSGVMNDSVAVESMEMDAAMPAPAPSSANSGASSGMGSKMTDESFVGTNVQVQGIDEGDVVKTDGKNIYVSTGSFINIVKPDFKMNDRPISTIVLPENMWVNQTLLEASSSRLIVMSNYTRNIGMDIPDMPAVDIMDEKTESESDGEIDAASLADTAKSVMPPYYRYKSYTNVYIYDVSDPAAPVLLREFSTEGNLNDSRLLNGTLYMLTSSYMYDFYIDEGGYADLNQLLPTYRDTNESEEYKMIAPESISYFPGSIDYSYTTLIALDVADGGGAAIETVMGSAQTMYMSYNAVYAVRPDYSSNENKLDVYKFDITAGGISFAAVGSVDGYIENQYAMDEYNGYFRIATTAWGENATSNAVYVLDKDMALAGAVKNLAPGERIYSVRFIGNTGYIVTFKQVDPLFVIDLSDPHNPTVKGELKIPGFSEYLHPLNENTLIGVGRETQEMYVRDNVTGAETVVGTRQGGVKLSLFDVSDPYMPKEITHKIIGGQSTYSEALYNARAFYFDANKGVIGLPFEMYPEYDMNGNIQDDKQFNGAMLFNVSESGFEEAAKLTNDDGSQNYYYGNERRLCSIGDKIYFAANGMICAFDYTSYNKTGSIVLESTNKDMVAYAVAE